MVIEFAIFACLAENTDQRHGQVRSVSASMSRPRAQNNAQRHHERTNP
jgi:hypothetical protein